MTPIKSGANGGGRGHRTFTAAETLPSEMLFVRPRYSGYDDPCAEGWVSSLTSANRPNATVLGVAPDVIPSVDSTAKRAGASAAYRLGSGLSPTSGINSFTVE